MELETAHEKIELQAEELLETQTDCEPKGMSDIVDERARLEDEPQQSRKELSSVAKEDKTVEQGNQSIPPRIVAAKYGGLDFGRRRPTVYNPQTKQSKP